MEALSRPSNNLKKSFLQKKRAHRLNAVPGYWCKIAEHCKRFKIKKDVKKKQKNKSSLFCSRELLTPHGTGTFQSISSRSLARATKMDRVISILASAIVDVVAFCRV